MIDQATAERERTLDPKEEGVGNLSEGRGNGGIDSHRRMAGKIEREVQGRAWWEGGSADGGAGYGSVSAIVYSCQGNDRGKPRREPEMAGSLVLPFSSILCR